MPVPKDIGDLAMEYRKTEAKKTKDGTFTPARPLLKPPSKTSPWYGMSWQEIQKDEALLEKVNAHLIFLEKLKGKARANAYLKYLMEGPQNN